MKTFATIFTLATIPPFLTVNAEDLPIGTFYSFDSSNTYLEISCRDSETKNKIDCHFLQLGVDEENEKCEIKGRNFDLQFEKVGSRWMWKDEIGMLCNSLRVGVLEKDTDGEWSYSQENLLVDETKSDCQKYAAQTKGKKYIYKHYDGQPFKLKCKKFVYSVL